MPVMNCKESVRECAISEAERELVLKANAMCTLADDIENATLPAGKEPAMRLTQAEWQLICYALRHTADSDN